MHLAQRMLLTVMAAAVLLSGVYTVYGTKAEKMRKQWEIIQTERFMGKAVRSGEVTEEEFTRYVDSLNYFGVSTTVQIEEYQRAEDMEGKIYFRLVSAGECQKEIERDGILRFRDGSVVKITVFRTSGKKKRESGYVELISGKG